MRAYIVKDARGVIVDVFLGNGDEKTTGYEERLARLGYTLTVKPTEPVSGLTEFISAEEAEAEAEEAEEANAAPRVP